MPEIVQAKEAFMAPGPTHVAVGDLFNSDDPIVSGREHLFAPIDAKVRATVPGAPVSPPPFLEPSTDDPTPDAEPEPEPVKGKGGRGKATEGA